MLLNIPRTAVVGTTDQQLAQLRSYMFQLVEKLNVELNRLDTTSNSTTQLKKLAAAAVEEETGSRFQRLRDLIIKTADTIYTYMDETVESLHGEYVAQSDFGTYSSLSDLTITTNAERIEEVYYQLNEIVTEVSGSLETYQQELLDYIRRGWLDNDEFGIEIGDFRAGSSAPMRVRITADAITFYNGAVRLAWVARDELNFPSATVQGALTLGDWRLNNTAGLALEWIG